MPEPQLTESDIKRIEAREIVYEGWGQRVKLRPEERDALIRDWGAMKARIEALTTDWCECGHSRDKHGFFSDHDECYECDQASPDLCCEWRPAPRPNENATLREQLARIANFASHADGCEWWGAIPRTTCSCGLSDIVEKIK